MLSLNVSVFHSYVAPNEKLNFELDMALISSQPWITAPKHLCMWSGGIYSKEKMYSIN